tara:strand:- start:64 stop:462 length:399 start_codon:yes stop_codon:yes gene_type:complete
VLCALVVSSKTWYDKAVFNVDFSERLPSYNLAHINTMETEFLSALDYRATVSVSLYAKCASLSPHVPRQWPCVATVPAWLYAKPQPPSPRAPRLSNLVLRRPPDRYFFALQDVLGTSNTRRSTWTAGESVKR